MRTALVRRRFARLAGTLAAGCALAVGLGAGAPLAAGGSPLAAGGSPLSTGHPPNGSLQAHSSSGLHLVQVAKFSFPTEVVSTPADPHAIYVLERTGRIWIVRSGHRLRHPFLDLHRDIRIATNSEQGLVGMAFSPDYAKSGLFYVYYTNRYGNIRVKQFRRSRRNHSVAGRGRGRTILALIHPQINHYGGHLAFSGGHLYVSIGDGGGVGDPSNHAQSLGSLFGKILRIDPTRSGRRRYVVPRNNPFAHRRGARHEIYAYGLRNPFKFSFDPKSGAVWIGDVGENRYEEIDYRTRRLFGGSNFGWSRYEGDSTYNGGRSAPGPVFPVVVEAHSGGSSGTHETWCAIIGGYVVRDPQLHGLRGHYLFGDHCRGGIYSTRIDRHGRAFATGFTGLTVPALVTTFGVDAKQRVYVAAENGWVYRIAG